MATMTAEPSPRTISDPPGRTGLSSHAVAFFATQLSATLAPILVAVMSARVLGAEGAGRFGLLMFYVLLGTTMGCVGIPSAITRFVASLGDDHRSATALASHLTRTGLLSGGAVSLLLVVLGSAGLLGEATPTQFTLAGLSVFLSCATALLTAAMTGRQMFGPLMRVTLVAAPVALALNGVALAISATVTSLMLAGLGANALTLALVGRQTSARVKAGVRMPQSLAPDVRRYLLPVSAIAFLDLVVWQRSEVLFLAHLASPRETALYVLPYGLVARLMALVPGAVSGVLLPRFSAMRASDARTGETYRRSLSAVTLLAAGVAAACWALAGPSLPVLFGPQFGGMAPVFRVLALSGALGAIAGVAAATLYGLGHQAVILRTGLALAVLNLSLDVLLIPRHGALGAAYANSASQACGLFIALWYLATKLELRPPWATMMPSCLAALVAGFAAALAVRGASQALALPLGVVAFLAVWAWLVVLVPVGLTDERSLWQTWRRR